MNLPNLFKIFNKSHQQSNPEDKNQWEYHFNPKKSKYHDYTESYFKHPTTGKILRFTAQDALVLISFHGHGWSPQKLFDEMPWGSTGYEDSISVEDIQLFLEEYDIGNMNHAISFICDNTIEYNYANKEDYLKI